MVLVAVEDAISLHSGSVCSGSVAGTVTVGSNAFVKIEGKKILMEDGSLVVPTHDSTDCMTPESHAFVPNTFQQSFVKIEGKKILLEGDAYTTDTTVLDTPGSNNFVGVIP